MRLLLVATLMACRFAPHAAGDGPLPGDGPPIPPADVAADGPAPDAPPPDGPPPDAASLYCDPGDPDLVACYRFEGVLADGSVHHLDPDVEDDVAYAAGASGEALAIAAMTEVDVADDAAFAVPAVTIEAWIDPAQLPPGRGGILDCDGRYGFFLYANGQLECIAGGTASAGPIQTGRWTHVACTSDGATTKIYIDGRLAGSAAASALSLTGSQSGITLGGNNPPGGGDPLVGAIDEVRLFSTARSAAQICADSTRTTCP